jgi:hypothetical protein
VQTEFVDRFYVVFFSFILLMLYDHQGSGSYLSGQRRGEESREGKGSGIFAKEVLIGRAGKRESEGVWERYVY